MKFLVKIISSLVLLSISHLVAAQLLPTEEEFQEHIQSCTDMWEQVRKSDCGSEYAHFIQGGNLRLGLNVYTFSLDINKNNRTQAAFDGPASFMPHYSVHTRRNYWDNSEFGYEFSLTYGQAIATYQTLNVNGKKENYDLGTYAVGDMFAGQANVFYSFGSRDDTPHSYATLGVGLGLGYASVRGRAYLTEDKQTLSVLCLNARNSLKSQANIETLKNECEEKVFDRSGIGVSLRALYEIRFYNFYSGIEASLMDFNGGKSFFAGADDGELMPLMLSITFAYIIDF